MVETRKMHLLVLFKDNTWQERECEMTAPSGVTEDDLLQSTVTATMSGLAATGEADNVYAIGQISEQMRIEMTNGEE